MVLCVYFYLVFFVVLISVVFYDCPVPAGQKCVVKEIWILRILTLFLEVPCVIPSLLTTIDLNPVQVQ